MLSRCIKSSVKVVLLKYKGIFIRYFFASNKGVCFDWMKHKKKNLHDILFVELWLSYFLCFLNWKLSIFSESKVCSNIGIKYSFTVSIQLTATFFLFSSNDSLIFQNVINAWTTSYITLSQNNRILSLVFPKF